MAIAMSRPVEAFCSQCLNTDGLFPSGLSSVDDLLLLVHDSTVYTKRESQQEWLDCIKLDARIIAIYATSGSAS